MKSILEQLAEFQRFPDVHEKYIMLHRWLDKESKKAIIINKKEREKEGGSSLSVTRLRSHPK